MHHFPMPPHDVLHAMRLGFKCWLEVKYHIVHGNVYAYATEWLCDGK